jgi:hypothetical protein
MMQSELVSFPSVRQPKAPKAKAEARDGDIIQDL